MCAETAGEASVTRLGSSDTEEAFKGEAIHVQAV